LECPHGYDANIYSIEYFAKLEGNNPFGSVKDRAAYWMIKDGEERGILKELS